jgi:hypothetical protein
LRNNAITAPQRIQHKKYKNLAAASYFCGMAKSKKKINEPSISDLGRAKTFTTGTDKNFPNLAWRWELKNWHQSLPAQIIIIGLLALLFYANSLSNEYALDDTMVITENKYTQAGLKGIKNILTQDSFAGSQGDLRILEGGRYRPLSIVTFALEYQVFGKNPFWGHLGNTVLYALLCIILLKLLNKHIFPARPLIAFLAAAIFTMHPVHSEAVANIKSRDEILSLLFLGLTLYYGLDALKSNRKILAVLSLFFFALALLSKENGLTFLFILPLAAYVFTNCSRLKKLFLSARPTWVYL